MKWINLFPQLLGSQTLDMNLVFIKFNSRHSGKLKVVKTANYSSFPRPFRIPESGQRAVSSPSRRLVTRSNTLPGSRDALCNDCSGTIVTTWNGLLSIHPITISICCNTLVRRLHDCVVWYLRSFQLSRNIKVSRVFKAQSEKLKIHMSHRIDYSQFAKLND